MTNGDGQEQAVEEPEAPENVVSIEGLDQAELEFVIQQMTELVTFLGGELFIITDDEEEEEGNDAEQQ